MANPYNDIRAISARLGQIQPRGTSASSGLNPTLPAPSQSAITLSRAANKYSIQNPELRSRIEEIANKGKSPAGGVVGTVLGNPIAKLALKPLEAFALPGRAVTAGLREFVDATDSNPGTRGSFGDFVKNVKDPTYGFGKAFKVDTGSKWLDRAIGFVGDVALDPLTYATFGAGKFAGYGGRISLSRKVLEKTGDKVLASQVARVGRSALKNQPEILERVGANKFGVYFFGKRIKVGPGGKGIRVPMSGAIGEIGESTLAKLRLGITDTRVGKYLQKVTMPSDYRTLRIRLAQGSLNPEDAADALKIFNITPSQRAARGVAQQQLQQELLAMVKSEEPFIESYRTTAHRFLTNPELLSTATDAERRAYDIWSPWLKQKRQDVLTMLKAVDPEAELGEVKDYFPLVASDDTFRWMASTDAKTSAVRSIWQDDPLSLPDAFTPRALRPGKEFFGYTLKPEDMFPERLNEIARKYGNLDFDFFELDIVKVMNKYVSDVADEIGIIKRNELLADTGFFQKIKEQKVDTLEVDEEAVASARNHLAEQKNLLNSVDSDFRSAVVDFTETLKAQAEQFKNDFGLGTVDAVGSVEKMANDMATYLYDMSDNIARKAGLLETVKNQLSNLFGPVTEISLYNLSDDFPVMLRPLLAEFDEAIAELSDLNRLVSNTADTAVSDLFNIATIDSTISSFEEASAKAAQKSRDLLDSFESAIEIANVLENNWESVVIGNGRSPSSAYKSINESIKDILGTKGTSKEQLKKTQKARTDALGIEGDIRDFLDGKLSGNVPTDVVEEFNRTFEDLAGYGVSAVGRSRVSRMGFERFDSIVGSLTSESVNIDDVRAAAIYAIGRDMRFYSQIGTPDTIVYHLGNLKEALRSASDFKALRVAQKDIAIAMRSLRNDWGTTYDLAVGLSDDISEYSKFIDFSINDIASEFGDDWRNIEFNEDVIRQIEAGMVVTDVENRLPWLYDFIDEPGRMLGKEPEDILTLGEVVDSISDSLTKKMTAYTDTTVTIPARTNSNLVQFANKTDKDLNFTLEEFVRAYNKEHDNIVSKSIDTSLPQDNRFIPKNMIGQRVPDELEIKKALGVALIKYQAVSEASIKFQALAHRLAPHGVIPDENMWRGILRTVSKQYSRQFSDNASRIARGNVKFTEFYNSFVKQLEQMKNLPADETKHISQVLKDGLAELLNGPDGDVLKEVLGPSMGSLVDPADMRVEIQALESAIRRASDPVTRNAAKRKLNEYASTFLIPWAKAYDPTITAKKGPALNLLKNLIKSEGSSVRSISNRELYRLRSPLSKMASKEDVFRWFSSMMDTVDTATGDVVAPGSISRMSKSAIDAQVFFRKFDDGYLNPHSVFNPSITDPTRTPSDYAFQLRQFADELDGLLPQLGDNVFVSNAAKADIGDSYMDSFKKGPRVAKKLDTAAAKEEAKALRASEIVAAFKNPNLTDAELKQIGFTKAMKSARDKVLEYNAFMSSSDYASAISDQEIIGFLDSVAGVDFSYFSDGIITGFERRAVTAGEKLAHSQSISEQIAPLLKQKAQIEREASTARLNVQRPFITQVDGKYVYKSPEARKIARQAVEDWDRVRAGEYRYRISAIDKKVDELQASISGAEDAVVAPDAANITVSYEEVPTFATMPNGDKITFSKAEWESLFIPPFSNKGLNDVGIELRLTIAERKKIQSQIDSINSRLSANEGAWSPGQRGILTKMRNQIRVLEDELFSVNRVISDLEFSIERNMKVTRNSALEKVRILVHGTPDGKSNDIFLRGWQNTSEQLFARPDARTGTYKFRSELTPGEAVTFGGVNPTVKYYLDKAEKANPNMWNIPPRTSALPDVSNVSGGFTSRQRGLQGMWKDNPSYSVLQQAEDLANEISSSVYADAEKNLRAFTKVAEDARNRADRATVASTEVQVSFRKIIEKMRKSEVRAARTAGADFNLPVPERVTNKDIRYTIGGKDYVIPTLESMLQNPEKALKRFRGQSNFFDDLRKPGNVTRFTQSPDEVKAAVGLHAFQSAILNNRASTIKATILASSQARVDEAYRLMVDWTKDIDTLGERIATVRAAIKAEADLTSDFIKSTEKSLNESILDAFEFGAELRASLADFNPELTLDDVGMQQMDSIVSAGQKRAKLFESVVANMPSNRDTANLIKSVKPDAIQRWRQVHVDWINNHRSVLRQMAEADLLNNPGEAKLWQSYLNASAAEARFIVQQGKINSAKVALDTASEGVYVEKVLKPATKEFEKVVSKMLKKERRVIAKDFNMPSYSVSSNINDIITNLERINNAQTMRQLGRFIGGYTGFFKAYATLSPGFHVRNSISNTFQLFAAGADVENMYRGLKLYKSLGEHIKSGGTFESWIASDAVPEALKPRVRIAGEVGLALGGGKTDEAFAEFMKLSNNMITDNPATRTSRAFGHRVEGSARFMLAFDSAMKDMDFVDSFNRTKRFLFDYNDPTILDEMVRNVIPFWTWMSRNLPLQIVTQWTNPKPYAIFQHAANNFAIEPGQVVPQWMMEKDALQVGEGTFVVPDLPMSNVEETIKNFENPRKMLSMLNPGFRVPLELSAGKEFFTGRELNNKGDMLKYAATSALPMVGQAERLTRSGGTADEWALARYLGIPIRGVNEKTRDNERNRRFYEMRNFIDNQGGQ